MTCGGLEFLKLSDFWYTVLNCLGGTMDTGSHFNATALVVSGSILGLGYFFYDIDGR